MDAHYVTEGMLSHLRQHIRGSKKAIAIACSLADVRGGDRGLDQAYGRQAHIGKAEVCAENVIKFAKYFFGIPRSNLF